MEDMECSAKPTEEIHLYPVLREWQSALQRLLIVYETRRGPLSRFVVSLFAFFVLVNIFCYWLAMFTAFPSVALGDEAAHYFFVQFPVGFLGALFDSASFFVTLVLVRTAARACTNRVYVACLSVDLLIAILATFWVLFVFISSGWLISQLGSAPELMGDRAAAYSQLVTTSFFHPLLHARDIYFGAVMGMSSMIPTLFHVGLAIRSFFQVRAGRAEEEICAGRSFEST